MAALGTRLATSRCSDKRRRRTARGRGRGTRVTFGTQTLCPQFYRRQSRKKDIHCRHYPADSRMFPRLNKKCIQSKDYSIAIPPLSPVLARLSLACRDLEDSSLWPMLAGAGLVTGPSPTDTPVSARSHPRPSTSGLEKLRVSLGFTEPILSGWKLLFRRDFKSSYGILNFLQNINHEYYLCTKYVFNLKVSCQFRSKKSKICSIKTIHQSPIQGVLFIGGTEVEGGNSCKKWSRPGFPGHSDNTDYVALRGRPVAQCPVHRGPGLLIKLQSDPRPPDLDGRVRESVFVFKI